MTALELLKKPLEVNKPVIQQLCYVLFVMLGIQLIVAWVFDFPAFTLVFILVLVLNNAFLIWLISKNLKTAKTYFLLSSYGIIAVLTPIFGYDANTHLFLIPGVGMPLIFFQANEIGKWRWIYVFLGIPVWLVIELFLKDIQPITDLTPTALTVLSKMNILFTLMTSIGMFYFFTNQINHQLNLIEEEKLLTQKANNRLKQFNHVLAHDLKSPFASLITVSNLVQKKPELFDREKLLEVFEKVESTSNKGMNLVLNVTEYFRLTEQQEASWFAPKDALYEVLAILDFNEDVKIEVNQLPDILMAQVAFERIAQNLLSNAVKYNQSAIKEVIISFSKLDDDFSEITFEDNGIGMSATEISKAFDHYTMFHDFSENSHSTGVGLAIIKELAQSVDGDIQIESTEGRGTTFHLKLPNSRFK